MADCSSVTPKTCVLRVNIRGPACEKRVHKLLRKINGVYSIMINGETGKVTVSGMIEPCELMMALEKMGEKAELVWEDCAPSMRQACSQTQDFDLEELQQYSKNGRVKQVKFTKNVKVKFKDHEDEFTTHESNTTKVDVDDAHGPKKHHHHHASSSNCHQGSHHGHATERNGGFDHFHGENFCHHHGHATERNGNFDHFHGENFGHQASHHHDHSTERNGNFDHFHGKKFCHQGCHHGHATERNGNFCHHQGSSHGHATERNGNFAHFHGESFCHQGSHGNFDDFHGENFRHQGSHQGHATEKNGGFDHFHGENSNRGGFARPQRCGGPPGRGPSPPVSGYQYSPCPQQYSSPPFFDHSYPGFFSDDNPHGCTLM